MSDTAMEKIPVVDLNDYRSAAGRSRFVRVLKRGFSDYGFILVEGHAVDPALVRRVYTGFEAFFAMDEAVKRRSSGVAGGQRGFTPFGVEHARDSNAPDLKEFFHVGQEVGQLANVWPAAQPGLREDATALFRALEACSTSLLEALAEGFELPRDTFASMIVGGNSILRALHYPPVAGRGGAGSLRAAPHEDINLITLLCNATEPGLEIRPPGRDEWLAVDVAPGRIVADSGDMLSRLTNGVVPATTHRVVNPGSGSRDVDRYSLPFFAHPRPECDLSVLPQFVNEERPRRYPPISAGGYLEERLREIGLVS